MGTSNSCKFPTEILDIPAFVKSSKAVLRGEAKVEFVGFAQLTFLGRMRRSGSLVDKLPWRVGVRRCA